ncbi:MAG TPA: DUF5695 domain-containing protein [Balneolaceae bacterium]|nr:DUF5695 domain-containing protein [Balneolaceae bacterium]
MNKKIGKILYLFLLIGIFYASRSYADSTKDSVMVKSSSSPFVLAVKKGAITSLKRKNDRFDTDYISAGKRFGDVIIRYRKSGGDWKMLSTSHQAEEGSLKYTWDENDRKYTVKAENQDLVLTISFDIVKDELLWQLQLENRDERPLEVGDIAVPFPMNHNWSSRASVTYNKRVIRHSMIEGNQSYIFWTRCNAKPPYLLMTPMGDTQLEYYDESTHTQNRQGRSIYTAYIHSLAQKKVIHQKDGSWRQPHTGVTLQPGKSWEAGFRFQWASGYDDIRQKLYENGLFDIYVEPGMTVPNDVSTKIALRNKYSIDKIEAEFPEKTTIKALGEKKGFHLYSINFKKLGENKLTVRYDKGRHMYLEFFVTQPIETLIKKRARFLVDRQQIDNPQKWYNGLFSDWDMKDDVLLSPDDIYNIPEGRRYMVASDDPALSRPSFLAKKNVIFPNQKEVDALDKYISKFVWGGLQMTTDESYPYAIYGIPDWKANRESSDPGPRGKMHIWRIYDYPHIIQMYLSMYRIARYHNSINTQLNWKQYLQRAYGTAMAYYLYPREVIHWSPYHTGNYNEVAILSLVKELESAGWQVKADRLRMHWERKVAYFLSGQANMFRSEYPYDTTGFESTYAFADYAMKHAGRSDKNPLLPLGVSEDSAWSFMKQQNALNVGSRGWVEKAYYIYGSDYRGGGNDRYTLSYMAQMGGWSILEYALHYATTPYKYLRLAYASELSSWALMNTGTAASNYGYWFPGKVNDGGAGGGFEPLAYGHNWLGQPHGRGSWYYSCEINLGFTGYLRAATTVLVDDPIFGMTAYGGSLTEEGNVVDVVPKDGVRKRFDILRDNQRVHIELSYAHFADKKTVRVGDNLSQISFTLENTDPGSTHHAQMNLSGLSGNYRILEDGEVKHTLDFNDSTKKVVEIPLTSDESTVVIKKYQK